MSPEELRAVRLQLELSQHELAFVLQTSNTVISRYERGRARPSAQTMMLYQELKAGWTPQRLCKVRHRQAHRRGAQ